MKGMTDAECLAEYQKKNPGAKLEDIPADWKKVMKEKGTPPMTNEELASKLSELQGQLDETSKRADKFEAVAKLSAEERVVYEKLAAEKQDEYLKADATARKDFAPEPEAEENTEEPEIAKRMEDIRKEFQDKLDAQKKESDARITKAENQASIEKAAREKVEFAKRAETELGAYPGTIEEKGALLGALCNSVTKTMSKEELEGLQKLFAAGQTALQGLMTPIGKDTGGEGSPEKKLEALVTKRMGEEKGLTYGEAYLKVANENPDLYTQIDNTRMKA
jgi:hypothetical protein